MTSLRTVFFGWRYYPATFRNQSTSHSYRTAKWDRSDDRNVRFALNLR